MEGVKKIVSFVFIKKTFLLVFKSDRIVVGMVFFLGGGNMRKRECY